MTLAGITVREPAAARVLVIVANLCTNNTRVLKEAEAIGREARALVRSRYSWESEAEKLLAAYEQILTSWSRTELRMRPSGDMVPAR